MKGSLIVRTRIVGAFFVCIALLLAARLYFVQVVHGAQYRAQGMGQYVEQSPESEDRGNMYFTTKDGELVAAAVMQSGWRIAINPQQLKDPNGVYAKLNAITSIDQVRFAQSAARTSDPYEEVAFRVDDDAAVKIRALKIPGVMLVRDGWRLYPGKGLAAQTLGFVGYKGEGKSKVGVYGLEKKWEDTLAISSSGLYVNPFAEIFTNLESAISTDPASHHGSIITSIEPSVQANLEKTLDEVMGEYTPRLAGGIIMDPKTGEILGMALRPGFDPNTYNIVSDPAVYANVLVSGRYEMGSIVKPLTMAAGMDAGAVNTLTTYNDVGCIERSNKTICNHDRKARGVVPMQEVLNQSLNLGVTFVADRMGHPTLTKYFKSYGLDEKTGIDLPDEVTGDLSPLGTGNGPDVNYAAASFGQGIAVSPIEMIRALAVLADDGKLPQPHLVTAIKYESGVTRTLPVPKSPQILKPETTETVTNMLAKVYDTALLKGALKMDHYTLAAKTGTAQIANPATGKYYGDRYLHSFFGYFPAHDPKFIVFLFAVEPHGQEFASATLAKPFSGIAQYLIHYYNIPPDR